MSQTKPCEEPTQQGSMESGVEKEHLKVGKENMESLKKELQEELVLTSSLTHLVAEKTSEIEYLKGKISEQDGRIRNLEDQIEEWTNQAEVCDKLLEQKDCEIEMLKKTLNIEKQQRRDLEDMMMESGRESLKEKEVLEKQVIELQARLEKKEKIAKEGGMETEENRPKETSAVDVKQKVGDESSKGDVKDLEKNLAEKEELVQEEKQNQEMEDLMTDMFQLIKQNEELKEEIEKLKTENIRILESKREVISNLEMNLDEKSAENERQRHEIRRMSSTIELAGMEVNPEKEAMMKTLREEYEGRVEECEFLSAELKARSDVSDAEKEALEKEVSALKKKLEMEREQNVELNRQILEVSNLYDMYYAKCEEMGKTIGEKISSDETKGTHEARSVVEEANVFGTSIDEEEETRENTADTSEDLQAEELEVGSTRREHEGNRATIDTSEINEQLADEVPVDEKSTHSTNEAPGMSEKILTTFVALFKLATLILLTITLASVARYVFHTDFVYAVSGLSALWFFVYKVMKRPRIRLESETKAKGEELPENDHKLRRALQDAVLRLDDENFRYFGEIYDKFMTDTFGQAMEKLPYDLQEEIRYLKASKSTLEKELQSLRERNQATNKDFMLMKREIDVLRIKRLSETEEKEKTITALKEEIKHLESTKSDKQGFGTNESEEDSKSGNPVRAKSFYIKYLCMVICACLCAAYVDDFGALPILTVLFVAIAIMMYKTDTALEYANSNTKGYQKTIKSLLSHVEQSKKEEKQISEELKEMEVVIEKDYEIITKQRQAIERLERQLQRAIRKYQEKKRLTLKFQWLQNHGFGPKQANGSSYLDADIVENPQEKSVKADRKEVSENAEALSAKKGKLEGSSRHENKAYFQSINIATIAVLLFAGLIAWYRAANVSISDDVQLAAYNYIRVLGPLLTIMFAVVALAQLSRLRKNRGTKQENEGHEIGYNDEEMLNEHVDTLRDLLSTEREVVTKLENELNSSKNSQIEKIPSSEINAVIDKLIDLSKQKDELQVTADTTKNKYENVKRTLEDILSREKYLSEEVASLRSQKRELQNDLMKEQIKHIDMFEEIKKLRQSGGEVDAIEDRFASENQYNVSEDDFSLNGSDEDSDMTDQTKRKSKSTDSENRDSRKREEVEDKDDAMKGATKIDASTCTAADANVASSECIDIEHSPYVDDATKADSNYDADFDAENSFDAVDGSDVDEDMARSLLGNGVKEAENETGAENEALRLDLVCLQDELAKERLRNFELSEKITALEIDQVLENGEGKGGNASSGLTPNGDKIVDGQPTIDRVQEEKLRFERQEALLNAKDRQLQELREIMNFINENRSKQLEMKLKEREDEQSHNRKAFDFQSLNKEKFSVELNRLAHEVLRLREICDGDLKLLGMEENSLEPQELVQYLTEQIGVFRYLISSDKAAVTAKMNAMEEKAEELGRQLVSLNNDIEKEKLARNHLIKEYEDEYERLESRLTEAYENIRKRLTEERVMRGQIMKQYENEIEEIQNKTEGILKELHHQLKLERKEKEDAEYRVEMIMKKVKSLEIELEMIEAKNKSEFDFDMLLSGKYDGDKNRNVTAEGKQHDLEHFKKAVDEETSKRTKKLKEKLDKTMKDVADYQNRLKERESFIDRLERQEAAFKRKIDVQDKRMKDLEHEVRASASMDVESACDENCCFGEDGIIRNLSTRNGTSSWENPAITGVVQVSRSSAGFGNASDILDFQALPCSTEDLEGSWFSVDFGEEINVIPESYSLRHGWISGDACLRSWILEGSMDASQWYTIQKHTRETTLSQRYSAGTWKITDDQRPFRHLRIKMTGKNSSNTNELYLSGFEVFGKIIRS